MTCITESAATDAADAYLAGELRKRGRGAVDLCHHPVPLMVFTALKRTSLTQWPGCRFMAIRLASRLAKAGSRNGERWYYCQLFSKQATKYIPANYTQPRKKLGQRCRTPLPRSNQDPTRPGSASWSYPSSRDTACGVCSSALRHGDIWHHSIYAERRVLV